MDRQSITAEEAIDQVYQFTGRVLGRDIADVTAQSEKVKSIFGKARKLVGYVKDIANVLALLKDYASGVYVQVPWRIVAALTGALFYVFSPADLIPDLIPLFGFADDATVFAAVMSFAQIDIATYLAWKAERGEAIEGGGKSGVLTIEKSDDITDWTLTDFVQVVQNALASIGDTGLRWFYGEPYVSQNAVNIVGKIMGGNGNISDVIGGIDMEAFQHCKDGFAFTRDRLYFRQFAGNSFSFKWREIVSIQYEGKELVINGIRLDNMCRDENGAKMVCKVLLAITNRADLTPEPAPYDESRYVPINEAIVKRFSTIDNGGLLFTGNNIPYKKRMGAHQAMNIQEPPEDICLVFDNSLFGTGKSGFALTSKAMYCKETFSDPARREWGCYRWVANPTSFWLMFVNNQPYYEISGSTLKASQISSIVDALNEFQMYHLNETGRSVEAKCKSVLEQIEDCEKAAAHDATAEDAEERIQTIAAASEVIHNPNNLNEEGKAATVIVAETKDETMLGRRVLKSASVERGHFVIRKGKYYLNEVITIGANAQLDMTDVDLTFGPQGVFVFADGKGDVSNCKFAHSENKSTTAVNGGYMFRGKCKFVSFGNCDLDGKGLMAGTMLDGDTSFFRCRIRNLTNRKQAGAVLGTPYIKGGTPKLRIKSTSVENCSATSQAVVWAMDLNVRDCEFVNCSSPCSIITVAEDCRVDVRNVVFDHCSVDAGGAVVGFYSNGGSNKSDGIGVDNCWLKDCSYQYSHNVNIPLAINNWVTEDVYRSTPDDPLRPFFLRDGSPLKNQIGANLNLQDETKTRMVSDASKDVSRKTVPTKKKTRKSKVGDLSTASSTNGANKAKGYDLQHGDDIDVLKDVKSCTSTGQEKTATKDSHAKKSRKAATNSSCVGKTKIAAATTIEKKTTTTSDEAGSSKKASRKSATRHTTSEETIKAEKDTQSDKAISKARRTVKNMMPTEEKATSSKSKPVPVEKVSLESAVKMAVAMSESADLYFGRNIPQKKLHNAIACMGVRVGEGVYALIDTTVFGSAKTGFIFTSLGIHWRNDWATKTLKTMLTWVEVKNIISNVTISKYHLAFSDEAVVSLAGSSVEPMELKSMLEKIVGLAV